MDLAYDRVVYYCGPVEAKSLITQPCQTEPSLVLVADMTSTHDNAMWLAEAILSDLQIQPAVTLLKASIAPGWTMPQIPGFKRVAAI